MLKSFSDGMFNAVILIVKITFVYAMLNHLAVQIMLYYGVRYGDAILVIALLIFLGGVFEAFKTFKKERKK